MVANDKYDLYPKIAELSEMEIVNRFKRPVLNRVEKDRSAYAETIFHLKGISQAEISFSHVITGVSKDGIKQDLFDGQIKWDLRRIGENWKIIRIVSIPKEKK